MPISPIIFYPSDEEFESDPFLADELEEQQREDDGLREEFREVLRARKRENYFGDI